MGDNNRESDLLRAVDRQDRHAVENLLRSGVSANACDATGKPALAVAVEHDSGYGVQITKCLLDAGADPNGTGTSRPLELATQAFHTGGALVAILLKAGASATLKPGLDLDALLCMVAWAPPDNNPGLQLIEGIEGVLQAGADPNGKSTRMARRSVGKTPLWHAVGTYASRGLYVSFSPRVIRLLVEAGADPTLKPEPYEESPVQIARGYGMGEVIAFFSGRAPQSWGTLDEEDLFLLENGEIDRLLDQDDTDQDETDQDDTGKKWWQFWK